MSVRTFTRRFREETSQSPGAWVTQQRVRHAQHLLEATELPVDQVAARSEMGTAASLRQHLRASVGVSPSASTYVPGSGPAGVVQWRTAVASGWSSEVWLASAVRDDRRSLDHPAVSVPCGAMAAMSTLGTTP
jgi:AraC-like DNA-binding protein